MAMGDPRRMRGQRREQRAERFSCGLGDTSLGRNFRSSRGEIDLLVRNRETVVFVEVRLHSQALFGDPLASIDQRKQRRIAKAALHYVSRFNLHDTAARFDVLGILGVDESLKLTHIKDAFELPPGW